MVVYHYNLGGKMVLQQVKVSGKVTWVASQVKMWVNVKQANVLYNVRPWEVA